MEKERGRINREYAVPERTRQFFARLRQGGIPESAIEQLGPNAQSLIEITESYMHDNDAFFRNIGVEHGVSHEQVRQVVLFTASVLHSNAPADLREEFPFEALVLGKRPLKKEKPQVERKETVADRFAKIREDALVAQTDEEFREIIPKVTRSQVQNHRELFKSPWKIAQEVGFHGNQAMILDVLTRNNIPYGKALGPMVDGRETYYLFVLPGQIKSIEEIFRAQLES